MTDFVSRENNRLSMAVGAAKQRLNESGGWGIDRIRVVKDFFNYICGKKGKIH